MRPASGAEEVGVGPRFMENDGGRVAQEEVLLAAFHRASSSVESAATALREISIARLPDLRMALEHAASEMESFHRALGEAAPALRRSAPIKSAGAGLANANARLNALYCAAADFHALLLRARSIERTGYGGIVQGDSTIGAWPAMS